MKCLLQNFQKCFIPGLHAWIISYGVQYSPQRLETNWLRTRHFVVIASAHLLRLICSAPVFIILVITMCVDISRSTFLIDFRKQNVVISTLISGWIVQTGNECPTYSRPPSMGMHLNMLYPIHDKVWIRELNILLHFLIVQIEALPAFDS